jgi:hypothetical protein
MPTPLPGFSNTKEKNNMRKKINSPWQTIGQGTT